MKKPPRTDGKKSVAAWEAFHRDDKQRAVRRKIIEGRSDIKRKKDESQN